MARCVKILLLCGDDRGALVNLQNHMVLALGLSDFDKIRLYVAIDPSIAIYFLICH